MPLSDASIPEPHRLASRGMKTVQGTSPARLIEQRRPSRPAEQGDRCLIVGVFLIGYRGSERISNVRLRL